MQKFVRAVEAVRSGQPAGESSSSSYRRNYDVFLSFIGEQGTAKIFTNKLYTALIQAGLTTFFKEEVADYVEKGGITEVERAILESRASIIVFSDHFASASNSSSSKSKWYSVVEELAKIMECRRMIFGNLVFPVYYEVDPSQVHASIGEALEKYVEEEEFKAEEEITEDKLRGALKETMEKRKFYLRRAMKESMELYPRVLLNPPDISESSFIQEIIEEIQYNKLCMEYMEESPRPEERKQDELWFCKEINLVDSRLSELPENPYCPSLEKLFLQQNMDLAVIPFSFFKNMRALQVLDLSDTSIKCLPPSVSSLVTLRELFVRDCHLLMELPPEIGALSNLKVLDLEGTKLIYLPKEIRMLLKLVRLKVSLYRRSYSESRGFEAIILSATLSKFYHLKELSIDVDPDCGWWDIEVEAIIEELCSLRNLQTLKLYLPKVELLQRLLQVTRGMAVEGSLFLPLIFPTLSNFRLIVGPHEQRIVSCLPVGLQVEFEKLEKCLKYVNGEGSSGGIGQVLKCTSTLFLERHWSIEKLSVFKIDEMDKLKFCLLVECNEMNAVVEGADFYDQQGDKRINRADGKPALGSLQYLGIHYMKNLECVWRGPAVSGCLSSLRIVDVHTCPNLSTIFCPLLLCNLTNLKELTLEDCPKVRSVIHADSCSYEFLLPSLEKISLLDLPELLSIFSGARIAPKLERMLVYNCPNLKTLSPMETSSMKEIKGEREWWEGLEWHKSEQHREQDDNYLLGIFVPLKSVGDLVEELAEAENLRLNTLRMFRTYTESQKHEENEVVDGGNVGRRELNEKRSSNTAVLSESCSFSSIDDTFDEACNSSTTFDEACYSSTTFDEACNSSTTGLEYSISPKRRPIRNILSWQKGELLGRGSFGSVYEGITDDGIFFAVREVSFLDEGSRGKQIIYQVEQEISLLSQFEHENIVQYFGTETDDGKLYIFLELVTKGSLANLYQKYNLRDSQVSEYTRQILSGLSYLHARNVIHRDIKCANILVDATGSVKLADFGLTRTIKLNDVKSCKGTAFWMAPEVLNRKSRGYGLAADIWSLGCTVLEMLTRQVPYSHLEGMQALFRIGKGVPPPIPNSLSKDAQDFILKCLQVNPDNRPTAVELLDHPFVRKPLSTFLSPHHSDSRS